MYKDLGVQKLLRDKIGRLTFWIGLMGILIVFSLVFLRDSKLRTISFRINRT